MLKELGYDGVGHIWLDRVAERLKSLDDVGLRLFQITMTVELAPDKAPFDPRFHEVLTLVKGRDVQFALLVEGLKPSDPAGDPRAVEILRQMSDLARDSGAQLLLYPHLNSWVERIEDAVRVADKVDRPNVGVMFNLCHWLRVDEQRDYQRLLRMALPRLWAVSINGADSFDDQPGWDRYIQPLDRGDFDLDANSSTPCKSASPCSKPTCAPVAMPTPRWTIRWGSPTHTLNIARKYPGLASCYPGLRGRLDR